MSKAKMYFVESTIESVWFGDFGVVLNHNVGLGSLVGQ